MACSAGWAAAGEGNNNSASKSTAVNSFNGEGEAAGHDIVPGNAVFFALPRPLIRYFPGK